VQNLSENALNSGEIFPTNCGCVPSRSRTLIDYLVSLQQALSIGNFAQI
jgi:hypothetical protein